MAKKRRRRRPSLLTKGINVGVLLLAFWPAIQRVIAGRASSLPNLYTAGLVTATGAGKFSQNIAIEAYGPMVAAIILKKAISMVRRTARV